MHTLKNIALSLWRYKSLFTYYYVLWKNKKIDYFQYEQLCKPFEIYIPFRYPCNYYYGINRAICNKYSVKSLPYNFVIEHGVYFGDNLTDAELKWHRNPQLITMGICRMDFLKKNGYNNVTSVGPYILYADFFKKKQILLDLKKQLGKTLLVFPSHSIEGVSSVFLVEDLCKEIKLRSKGVQTVLVCMYWKDILEKRHLDYVKNGFIIVCAGYRNDPYFLSRLKDLIYLSDVTMSNSLGTHIGYCISMDKPHYLFAQDNTFEGPNLQMQTNGQDHSIYLERKRMFEKAFGEFSLEITRDQVELVKFFWGDFNLK